MCTPDTPGGRQMERKGGLLLKDMMQTSSTLQLVLPRVCPAVAPGGVHTAMSQQNVPPTILCAFSGVLGFFSSMEIGELLLRYYSPIWFSLAQLDYYS